MKEFNKDDFKSGDLVLSTNGSKFIVFQNKNKLFGRQSDFVIHLGDNENERGQDDLSAICKRYRPIKKVYRTESVFGFRKAMNNQLNLEDWSLIWDDTPEKIHTIDGIEYSESSLISIIKKAHK